MENIAWFDIISLSLVVLLGVKGIVNGLMKELFGLVGLIGGIFFASRYAEHARLWVDKNLYSFENKAALYFICFLGLLLIIWLGALLLGQIVSKLLSMSGLGFFDKIAGFFIGSAKIFLVFSVFFTTLSNISFVQEKLNTHLIDSFMYPIFLELGLKIVSLESDPLVNEAKKAILSEDLSKEEVIE